MDTSHFSDATATIFNIQKFCTDDGPGIRTTVFLKGCNLRCSWCHNPEGLSALPVIEYNDRVCAFCRKCEFVCPNGCHTFSETVHSIDRSRCARCGKCVDGCEQGAVKFCGQVMTAKQVLETAMADKAFYDTSGGGITISGGEPLLNRDFVIALCALARENGIHTCVETAGAVPFETIQAVMPFVDLFLFDIKETDDENHIKYIGVPKQLPHENLRKLDAAGGKVLMRCPIIPGVNDRPGHFEQLKALRASLKNAVGIQLMPYHILGKGKVNRFGIEGTNTFRVPTKEEVEQWNSIIKSAD